MKLTALILTGAFGITSAVLIGSGDKREECEDCVEDLDEAKECLRTCNFLGYDPNDPTNTTAEALEAHGSILNNCLDPSRDDGSIESLDELIECCQMTKDCEKELEDAQECVQFCFDPCIKEKSQLYLECIEDESEFGDRKCDRQECLDGFLEDLEDDADFSGDILDMKNVEKRIKKIDEDDTQDCSLMEDFVDSACDIGDQCCEKCVEELSYVVDCLINDIVVPWVAIEANHTVDECPIDDDCSLQISSKSKKSGGSRKLKVSKKEEALFNKALNLPKERMTKRDPAKEAAIKAADRNRVLEAKDPADVAIDNCQKKMEMNTIAHNISYAVTTFMQCVSAEAISRLPEGDTTSGASTFQLVTVAATIGGMFFMF